MASHRINALSQRMDALHARLSNRVVKLETVVALNQGVVVGWFKPDPGAEKL